MGGYKKFLSKISTEKKLVEKKKNTCIVVITGHLIRSHVLSFFYDMEHGCRRQIKCHQMLRRSWEPHVADVFAPSG